MVPVDRNYNTVTTSQKVAHIGASDNTVTFIYRSNDSTIEGMIPVFIFDCIDHTSAPSFLEDLRNALISFENTVRWIYTCNALEASSAGILQIISVVLLLVLRISNTIVTKTRVCIRIRSPTYV
jgi:hypothetical protein